MNQHVPKLHFLNAICRLIDGPAKADFAIVVSALADDSGQADTEAIETFGPAGESCKGKAIAYRTLLDQFQNPIRHLEILERSSPSSPGEVP